MCAERAFGGPFEYSNHFMIVDTTEKHTFHYKAVSVVNILANINRYFGAHGMHFRII